MSRVAGFFSPIEFLTFKLSWHVQANAGSFSNNRESPPALSFRAQLPEDRTLSARLSVPPPDGLTSAATMHHMLRLCCSGSSCAV